MGEFPGDRSFVQAALDAVSRAGMASVDMRYFAARDGRPADYCRERVRECEVYVAVIGFRYGSMVPGEAVSYTELEFDEASVAGLPRLVFLLDGPLGLPSALIDADRGALEEFRQRLRGAGLIVRAFTSAASLELEVFHALREVIGSVLSAVQGTAPPTLTVRHSLSPDAAAFAGRDDELGRITAGVTEAATTSGVVAIHAIGGTPRVSKTALAVHVAHLLRDRFRDRQLLVNLHGHTPQEPVTPEAALTGLLTATGLDARHLPADLEGGTSLHRQILAADSELLLAAGAEPSGAASTTLSPPAPVVPRQLPAATRHFAGRAEALEALRALAAEAAEASHATVISVIGGTAGIGKTTLALHFAHQVAGRFPDGQLYVNLRGFDPAGPQMTSVEAVRLFLDALAVPAARIPAGLDAQAGLYRSLLVGKRMLVLLDNARDVDQVRPLLPASPGCLVIVTSRSQLTSLVATEGASPLTLDVLTDAEAQELLRRCLGPARVADDPSAAGTLIELCARLPLALSIAAARTHSQPWLSLAALTADLRDARSRLDALDAGHATANVRTVLSWSYKQLDPTAARLFRLLGLHAGPDISAPAAASLAGLPLDEGRRGLGELTRAHLLAEHVPGRFSCHDLLRAYAAELTQSADSEAERRAATGRMLDHYLHTAHSAAMQARSINSPLMLAALQPGVEPERISDAGQALAWFEAEHRVLMTATGRAMEAGFDTHVWQLAWALSDFFDMRGRWHDWAVTEQIALAATQRLGDRGAQASAHQRFGYASGRIGRFEDAHAHLGLALSIHNERGDHVGQAYVHNSLAITLSYQGRHGEALGHARQSVESYTAAGDRPGQAQALNSVGWLSAVVGDHQQAISYCEQSLDLFHDLGSQEGEASALDSLGHAHHQAGHYDEATACYQQALELHRAAGSRWGAGDTLGHLGDTCHAAGKPEEARTFWEEALAILADLHAPEADQIRAKLRDLGAGLRH
jgi:tetratricopeptide (TPR) repeat protein